MSWSGYIPGDLVRRVWEKEMTEDAVRFPIVQGGTNTSSASPEQSADEQNALGGELEQSSYETEGSFLRAITALQEVNRVVSMERAREEALTLTRVPRTTQEQVRVSQSTLKRTLYCGLIATTVAELCSIAQIPLVEVVGDSSKDQESSESSRPKKYLRSDDPEPPYGSIVLDDSGDAWQRSYESWDCAMEDNEEYSGWSWQKLTRMYSRVELVYTPED